MCVCVGAALRAGGSPGGRLVRCGRTASQALFDYDEWLTRQRVADVPVIFTDTPRIRNAGQSALRKAPERWAAIDEPTLAVLPIEPWWLREGLSWLT